MTKSALQPTLDVSAVRNDFPILGKPLAEGRPLIYLDNGATTQKPQCVIDKVTECYENYNANVHRGVHTLGDQVTTELENARETVQNLLNAAAVEEIIFTAGTIAAINLVAHGWGLTTVAVMCGQGLVEHVDYLDAQLKAGCAGVWEPLEDVLVYASSSTYAAEESGLPPNMEAMPGAMEAMLRRLFNE